ncbi:phage major tail tube protein [Selenomonadales bacterium OttesenSCG-928-I06]|nr:phage major tail tube protein [Selenomonadales bacterium OttesenSCG-928-I06]
MGGKLQPEALINTKVYDGVNDLLGIANITLPDIENLNETVSGAGIAGEVEAAILGHFSAMSISLEWRTINKHLISLSTPNAHDLDIRGAQQVYDPGSGEVKVQPVRIYVKCRPKKLGLGSAGASQTTGSTTDLEVVYIKVIIDGETFLELDKFNYICIIGGTDILADVREALGIF